MLEKKPGYSLIIAHNQTVGTLWVGRQAPILEDEINLLASVGEILGNAIHCINLHVQTKKLLNDIKIANLELSETCDDTLKGWAKSLEMWDEETAGHCRQVIGLTLCLARRMGISEPELTHISRGVLLHDIGKIGIPEHLLKKTGPLTAEEWVEMRKHPQIAYALLSPVNYLHPAIDIPYCHHERWDGNGYPLGLKGKEIPLTARIFAVVDVFDALSNNRPYRSAWPRRQVLNYLCKQSGKNFDPQIVEEFFSLI